MSWNLLTRFGLFTILALVAFPVKAGILKTGTTVELSDDHSVFNLSVYPAKAGYDNGTVSGSFGDGTVLDYRFFNNSDSIFNESGYANGGVGLISSATATDSDSTNGGALDWADVWTTNDPGTGFSTTANYTSDTVARSQGVIGSINISGLSDGSLYFIYGAYENPNTLTLTMTGDGQPDIVATYSNDPPNTNKGYLTSFNFSETVGYDNITWNYTNTDTDASRARFMGLIMDGTFAAVPEPSTFALAALGLLGLLGWGWRRKR